MKRIVLLLLLGLLYLPSLTFAQTKNIDCNDEPSVPEGFTLFSSQPDGTYKLDPVNIKTVSFENKTSPLTGEQMLTKLKDTGLNACVLDYLFDHQELIPEAWKTKYVMFSGSIFMDGGGNKFFRTLYWWDNHWDLCRTFLSEPYDDRIAAIK